MGAETNAVIGIAGGAGAGKSTVAQALAEELEATHIALDSFYTDLDDLDGDDQSEINYDHPRTIDWSSVYTAVSDLRSGQVTSIPIYDFDTARRTGTRMVHPQDYIIVDGIHALVDDHLRTMYDTSVYIELEAHKRLIRRLRRDVEDRGDTYEAVIDRHEEYVHPMHERFIGPSKWEADLVCRGDMPVEETVLEIVDHHHYQ